MNGQDLILGLTILVAIAATIAAYITTQKKAHHNH